MANFTQNWTCMTGRVMPSAIQTKKDKKDWRIRFDPGTSRSLASSRVIAKRAIYQLKMVVSQPRARSTENRLSLHLQPLVASRYIIRFHLLSAMMGN